MDYYIFKYIAALFAPLGGHELTIAVGKRKEEQGEYIFKASSQGLKVLDTLTNSVGEAMDLKTGGDILLSINGNRIYSKEDMEEVLYCRPNYICMDIFDIKKRVDY